MDIQRKKGILEVCVLAVLKKGPSYGYLMIRELEQCVDISESTLYPILKRLEQNGSLRTYRQEYNGRMRKYYCLTPEGQKKIDVFLDEWDELQNMYRFVETQNSLEPVVNTAGPDRPESAADAGMRYDPCSVVNTAGPDRPESAADAGVRYDPWSVVNTAGPGDPDFGMDTAGPDNPEPADAAAQEAAPYCRGEETQS